MPSWRGLSAWAIEVSTLALYLNPGPQFTGLPGAHRRHHGRIAFPRRPSSSSWPPARCCRIFVFISSAPTEGLSRISGKHCLMTQGTWLMQAQSKPPPPHEPAFPSSQVAFMVSYLMSSCTSSLKAHTPVYMLLGPAVGCRAAHQTRRSGTCPRAGLHVLWAEGHELLTEVTLLWWRAHRSAAPLRISTGHEVCAWTRRESRALPSFKRSLGVSSLQQIHSRPHCLEVCVWACDSSHCPWKYVSPSFRRCSLWWRWRAPDIQGGREVCAWTRRG